MDIIAQACERAKQFEGFMPAPYTCPAGKLTIGYGTNLQRREMPDGVVAILGRILIASINTGCVIGRNWSNMIITPDTAEALLLADMEAVSHELRRGNLNNDLKFRSLLYPEPAQLVILDMAYNMGVPALLGFKRMLAALDRGDWSQAAGELLDSKYASQVGPRAQANADLLRGLTVEDMTIEQRVRWLEEKRKFLDRKLKEAGVL